MFINMVVIINNSDIYKLALNKTGCQDDFKNYFYYSN